MEITAIALGVGQAVHHAQDGVPSNRGGSDTMKHSTMVARRHPGSILIDALLVRSLAGHKVLLHRIAQWQRFAAGRRELMALTDRDLHDIGIGRREAETEANKPFWET
jgi:uncharacterized protein YjiS (DUF1127 family)